YDGRELAAVMREKNVFCEFYDPDFVVMMLTPETGRDGLERLERAMCGIPRRPALTGEPPEFCRQERVLSVREAVFFPRESVPVGKSAGRVLASMRVACPPAVPVVICGERIDGQAVKCFEYYGIETCQVAADAAL
ncbi:MAG: amino acid decarboxylase, partial [Eubacteriales bacterium]